MSEPNPLVEALVAHAQVTLDLVWALEWLNTLTDMLPAYQISEFYDELQHRRTQSDALNAAAKEAQI